MIATEWLSAHYKHHFIDVLVVQMSSTPDHPADNPYELLDVSVDASETDIKTAYRRISLKVHPDRVCLTCF